MPLPDFCPALLQEFPSLRGDEFGEMPALQFFGREPPLRVDVAAHVAHDPVGIQDQDQIGRGVENGLVEVEELFHVLPEGDVLFELIPHRLGVLFQAELHLPLAGHVLERLDGRNDLALLVQDGRSKEVEVSPFPAYIFIVIRRLVGPLDDRGLLDFLLPVEFLQALQVAVHDEIGDHGALLLVEGHPLVVRADHLHPVVTAQCREGRVPEDDAVVAVDDERRDRRALDDPFDRLAQPDVFLELPLQRLGMLLSGRAPAPARGSRPGAFQRRR